jgi:hypothetical protein
MSEKYIVFLTQEKQKKLKSLISKSEVKAKVLKRSCVLLAADTRDERLCNEPVPGVINRQYPPSFLP